MVDCELGVDQIKIGPLKGSWVIVYKMENEDERILTVNGFRPRTSPIQPDGIMVWYKWKDAYESLLRFIKDLSNQGIVESFSIGMKEEEK